VIVMMVVVGIVAPVRVVVPRARVIDDRWRPVGFDDDRCGGVALDHDGGGRRDHDWRRVDGGGSRADETADDTADQPA
jgi:hypothetical protein